MTTDLEKKIIQQIEYYFGDINLPRDKFMQEKLKDDEGWIPLDVLLTFKRLANLSTDHEVIASAVEKSDNKLVVVSEDRKKLRRSPDQPLPELNEERRKELMSRTAYAKGFPLDEELDEIIKFFNLHGKVESCSRRTYLDRASKTHKFKGSCFVIFNDTESCKKFIEEESIKYKENDLIRKWQSDYIEEKKKEFEDHKKNKKEKKEAKNASKPEHKFDFPKGAILHFECELTEPTITREEIKEKVKEIGDVDASFIDYQKGNLSGHIRLPNENDAIEFNKKLTDGQLEVGEIKLKFRVLDGEEEEEYLKKTAECLNKVRQNKRSSYKNNRKRRNNFSDDGPKTKVKNEKKNNDKKEEAKVDA